MNKFRWSP